MAELTTLLAEFALGGGVGFCIGLTGIGGGVLVVPALTLLLGLPATVAVGTASAYICGTNILASYQHARLGNIDFRMAHRFLAGAIPGNVIACLLIAQAKRNAGNPQEMALLQSHLKTFIAGVMIFSIVLMLANLLRELRCEKPVAPETAPESCSTESPMRRIVGLVLGAVVGAILGATSVGGGVVLVPLLIICFGMSARYTVGTSSYLALVLMLSTSLMSAGRGDVLWSVAGLMAVGSIGGVMVGIRLGKRLPENLLRGAMIILLLIAAAGMLLG